MDDENKNVPGQQYPMALTKSKCNSSLEECIKKYTKMKETNNFKLINEDHKIHNKMNYHELGSAEINNNKNPTDLDPESFQNLKLSNTGYMKTTME